MSKNKLNNKSNKDKNKLKLNMIDKEKSANKLNNKKKELLDHSQLYQIIKTRPIKLK
jgi:hypothetical protein